MFQSFLRQTKIPLRVRKKLGKILPVRAGQTFAVHLFENVYQGVTGNHLDDKTFLYGMHEPASIRLMRGVLLAQRAAGLSPIYMDIGTNTAAHLLGVASLADRAFGFEPWAPVRERAAANIARNPLGHVTLFDFGMGDRDAQLPFAPPDGHNHGTGSFFRRDENSSNVLQVRKGDALVSELNIKPTLIKIDTEGYEETVLRGLAGTLRQAQPVVVFEYSAMTKKQLAGADSLKNLFGEGYDFYGLKSSREYPKLEVFKPGHRYENLVAWPKSAGSIASVVKA